MMIKGLFRNPLLFAMAAVFAALVTMGNGCSSDPNVEGAKLDLRNKDYDRALENLSKALENNPDNAQAYLLQGQVYQEMANEESDLATHTELVENMKQSYARAGELSPDDQVTLDEIGSRRRLQWYNEYQRGLAHYNRSEYGEAAAYFENATGIEPDSASTYVNLAFAYISGQEMDKAILPLEKAIEKGDRNPDTYNYLSDLYLDNDRPEDAVNVLESAADLFPENEEVKARLFNAYVRGDMVDRAVDTAKAEADANPDNALHQYNYGSLLLEAEDYDGAIEHLGAAVALDPGYVNALFNLGAAYQNKGVAVNDEMSVLDEKLRNEADELSGDEQRALEEEMAELAAGRDSLFSLSVPPLETARTLTEEAGEDVTGICTALGQAYARTNQMDKATEAYACAEGKSLEEAMESEEAQPEQQ